VKEEILEYWNEQARKYRENPLATTPDLIASELEINEILKYITEGQNVLDIGCGNGYKDFEYCKERKINLKGIDYSQEMIDAAKDALASAEGLIGDLKFTCGNVLKLEEDTKYDVVITNRCLINLESDEQQMEAIDNIFKILKDDGLFLMMECTKQGLEKIDEVRGAFGLEEIKERWHNYYLNENKILPYLKAKFKSIEINNFNSTYFLISRTINALVAPNGQQADYNSDINKYAAKLPPIGEYAPLKLFVIKK